MKGVGPGIFSIQAVLISLVLHVIIIGGLFMLGKPESEEIPHKSEAESPEMQAPVAQDAGSQEPSLPVKDQKADSVKSVKADSVKIKSEKPPEKSETKEKKPGPVEIRIEPANNAKSVDKKEEKRDEEKSEAKKDAAGGKTRVYVVKRGDTLTALARDCGLTVSELAELNGKTVKKLSNLRIGQRIKLPEKD